MDQLPLHTPPSSTNQSSSRTIMDLEMDALAHCASYIELQDVSNMAMTCKFFKSVAYSDSVWRRLFRERWPQQISSSFIQTSAVREAYLARHIAVRQFRFFDPLSNQFLSALRPCKHILLDKNDIIISQDSKIILKTDAFAFGRDSLVTLQDHKSRITCMRLFPINETSLFRSEAHNKDNALVTSSCDHTIRLWWKGRCQRCFRGHNGPVTTLADRLLGDCNGKVLASGGEDGTVRLWSLNSNGKRGQHALKTTLHGHEKPIALISVSGHKTSLLVSISKDAKVRVWDATMSSLTHSSGCVGMTTVPGAHADLKFHEPVVMKCHESLSYVAVGSLVTAIDLRSMRKAFTAATHPPKIYSFEMLPSKYLICTGGYDKAMLWDVRKSQDKLEPVAELEHFPGLVSHLHMDSYKVVTATQRDSYINVWETNTGMLINSFSFCNPERPGSFVGCSAMAVNGSRIVIASLGDEAGLVCYRDYINATCPISSCEDNLSSKFWEPHVHFDTSDD